MNSWKTSLLLSIFLISLAGQAFAANLNSTIEWQQWQRETVRLQQMKNDAYRASQNGTSAGLRQAAALSRQMAQIHADWADRWARMASATSDPAIRAQANYQSRGRNIAYRSLMDSASFYDRQAQSLARLGR